jgi:hypothetical protein
LPMRLIAVVNVVLGIRAIFKRLNCHPSVL